jgi:hypothetical protein
MTMIYHQALAQQAEVPIEHYRPCTLNQVTNSHGKPWSITIHEQEYQSVSPSAAAQDESATGNSLCGDRIVRSGLFPLTLSHT